MMLDNISTEDLEKEIDKRRKQKAKDEKPIQLKNINVKPLKEICQNYINDLEKNAYVDEDYEHYIFEIAMECIFGEDVWKWINKKV